MGGNSLLPLPVADFTYGQSTNALNLDTTSSLSDQLTALLVIDPETFLASVPPGTPLLTVLEGEIVTSGVNFANWTNVDSVAEIQGTKWCSRVMLGDCQFDVCIIPSHFVFQDFSDFLGSEQ